MRWLALLALLTTPLAGCVSPRVVDCGEGGRYLVVDGESWCVIERAAFTRCPVNLPERHDLFWGDRACAGREFDPPPDALCELAGPCGDGGT